MPLTLNPSQLTWGQAKTRVARAGGVEADTDWLLVAQDAIKTALHRIENASSRFQGRDWSWLFVTAGPLTTTNSLITLPGTFKKEFSARAGSTPLIWMPQRVYDRANPSNTGDGPLYYTMFNSANTGTLEVLPPVANGTSINVRYWRRIDDTPANDSELLDVPQQYEDIVIALAKAALLADKDPESPGLAYWENLGRDMLVDAVANDVTAPDADEMMVPGDLYTTQRTIVTPVEELW